MNQENPQFKTHVLFVSFPFKIIETNSIFTCHITHFFKQQWKIGQTTLIIERKLTRVYLPSVSNFQRLTAQQQLQTINSKTNMSNFERPSKLKYAYSIQTACTLSQASDYGFKINILPPKGEIDQPKQIYPLIKELEFQEQECSPSNNINKNLMEIPILCKKQHGFLTLEGSTNSEPLQSQQLRASNKSIMKSQDVFDDSMLFTEMIIENNLKEEPFLTSSSDNIIKPNRQAKRQENPRQKIKEKTIQGINQGKSPFQSLQNKQTQQNSSQRPSQENPLSISSFKMTAIYDRANKTQHSVEDQIYQNRYSQNYGGKMKLKDYLYMVSAAKMQAKKNKRQQSKAAIIEVQTIQKISSQKLVNPNKNKQKIIQTNMQTVDGDLKARKQAIKTKYSVSNSTMMNILKTQIEKEIEKAEDALKKMMEQLKDDKYWNEQPTNEQILILYNLRSQLKDEINRKIQNALEVVKYETKSKEKINTNWLSK